MERHEDRSHRNRLLADSLKTKTDKESFEKFPLPIYFQTHFEYIHDLNANVRTEINQMKRQLNAIEKKLDKLLTAIDKVTG